MSVNRVILVGHLGADPEVRATPAALRRVKMTKLKEALEKLLEAAHPAYVSDDHFRKKLIVARDNALQELESHRLDMEDHIADAGEMVSLRDYFAAQVIGPAFLDLFTGWRQRNEPVQEDWPLGLAIDAYRVADAMLKERTHY